MLRLHVHSPHPARLAALLEQLANWPELEVHSSRSATDLKAALANKPDALLLDVDEDFDSQPYADIPRLRLGPAGDMPRPLRWGVLAGRLTLLLGRSEAEEGFAVGPYNCLPLERILIDAEGEERAKLTDKEVSLLRMLGEQGKAGMSRDELLEKVWGYREGLDTHTLETHIYRLRQKIETDPADPQLLLTIEGGYRLAEPS